MAGLELLIFGLTAAFMGCSAPSSPIDKPSERPSTRATSAPDNLFLVHRRSFFNDPLSSNAVKDQASNSLISRSFDDQVEDLLDNPW